MGNLEKFISENSLLLEKKLGRGWSADIFLVQNFSGKKFILKVLREKSNRRKMAEKETEFLRLANSVGIGPKWLKTDSEKNIVMMDFVEGLHFSDWLFSQISKPQLENFLDELLSQARKLDEIGLDHCQLAGKGHNILVRDGLPVIIDFEKASRMRKVHNVNVLQSFLFKSKRSSVVKKINTILGKDLPDN